MYQFSIFALLVTTEKLNKKVTSSTHCVARRYFHIFCEFPISLFTQIFFPHFFLSKIRASDFLIFSEFP